MHTSYRRSTGGTSLIETLCGAMFMIPIMLFAVDLSAIVLANEANDHLAKDAARSAANQLDKSKAKTAADTTVKNFRKSGLVTNIDLDGFDYEDKTGGEVTVTTKMTVTLPAPFPGFTNREFLARSVEPIVATPAPM